MAESVYDLAVDLILEVRNAIINNLLDEQSDAIAVINQVITQTLLNMRSMVSEFSRLFPTLVITPEEVEAWVRSQPAEPPPASR